MAINKTCRCDAYPFPHRQNGGKCEGVECYPCGRCGAVLEPIEITVPEISEHFGAVQMHDSKLLVSRCCGVEVDYE